MTIKPIKSDKNESDVPGQHRECLNKISSPKSPSTQHGIEPRSGLRNANYGVDDVVVNRHRRTNQKSSAAHGSSSSSNTQKHHKQRMVNLNSTNNPCTNDSNVSNENEAMGMGTSTNSNTGNALSSMQPTSSNVITNNCFIANAACNNNNLNNNNASNISGSQADVNLLKKSPARDNEIDDDQNSYSGYNSGDEHNGQKCDLTPEEWEQRDKLFIKTMSDRGFVIEQIVEDGACLFRSISLQIYGDQDMHEIIRQQTMDYIYQNREYFTQFVTEDIDSYVSRKRNNHVHGNHIEIQAISEIFNRPVEIYAYHIEPVNIFGQEQIKEGIEPLRLLYQRGSHYNAILNPYKPTVGLGLGLAGYRITDEAPSVKQFRDAIRSSEDLEIEQTMFEDKLKTTDWEATNEAIEEQIARESYLQWCREKHKAQKQNVHNKMMQQQLRLSPNSNVSDVGPTNCQTSPPSRYMHPAAIVNTNIGPQSSSTITSTATGATPTLAPSPYSYAKMRDSDDSGSCESIDFYTNNLSPTAGSSNTDDRQQGEHSRNRKRRSNRRKTSQNVCNPGFAPVNDVPTNCTFVMNTTTTDTASPKKRKFSGQDVPGPSSHTKNSNQMPNETPMSEFYHSLLESSYENDFNSKNQLTEQEMIEKALQMSRLEFMQSKAM